MSTFRTKHGWVRDQVEAYERSGGNEANTLLDTGMPIIIVTIRGNKSGNVRKIALMRVEHDGEYALVASYGGRPEHPVWYHNLTANPDDVAIQDGPSPSPSGSVRSPVTSGPRGGTGRSPSSRPMPSTRRRPTGRSRSSSPVEPESAVELDDVEVVEDSDLGEVVDVVPARHANPA